MNRKSANSGFTLIEALVVIALTGILVAMAVPSMRSTIERSSISSQVNSYIGALRFARSEAIKLGATVKMCRS
ncbi:MAG: GspH/FimT family pseudopilin, partial [Burkholderiaceae bacterium]|nr:GspH/FimT family pseudopilin [Burkholderiaceae bacterium]